MHWYPNGNCSLRGRGQRSRRNEVPSRDAKRLSEGVQRREGGVSVAAFDSLHLRATHACGSGERVLTEVRTHTSPSKAVCKVSSMLRSQRRMSQTLLCRHGRTRCWSTVGVNTPYMMLCGKVR